MALVEKAVESAPIDPEKLEVVNEEDRIFKGFLSVEVVDTQGDLVPIDELEKVMVALMKRGGAITDTHTNRVVGKILNWQKVIKDGKPAILITGQIFKDYPYDDAVWEAIKQGKYKGLSIGGRAEVEYEGDKRILKNLELFEVSVCEMPANPEAVITAVNTLAKSACVEDDCETVAKDCKDRYLVKEPGGGSHFKEMTCPDDPSKKSRFCGCVRYQMTCNGKSLESAKRICAYIKRMKYGSADVEKIRYPSILNTIAGEMYGKKFAELGIEAKMKVIERVDDYVREWQEYLRDMLKEEEKQNTEKAIEVTKPFAGFKDFNDCLNKMRQRGYDELSARNICGKLYWEYEKADTIMAQLDSIAVALYGKKVSELSDEEKDKLIDAIEERLEGEKEEDEDGKENVVKPDETEEAQKNINDAGEESNGASSVTEETPVRKEEEEQETEAETPASSGDGLKEAVESLAKMVAELKAEIVSLKTMLGSAEKAAKDGVAPVTGEPPGETDKPEKDQVKPESKKEVKMAVETPRPAMPADVAKSEDVPDALAIISEMRNGKDISYIVRKYFMGR